MPNQILIEGVDVSGGANAHGRYWVDWTSVEVDQDIAVQQTTATFDLWIRGTYQGDGQWKWPIPAPRAEQEVVFLDAEGTRQFGGILVTPKEAEITTDTMIYTCQCGDFSQWFDRHLVNQTFAAGITVQELVQNTVDQYVNTPGNTRTFNTSGVQVNPSVPLPIMQFYYLPPSQVMAQIVDLLGWGWYLGFDRTVHLYSSTYLPCPFLDNILNLDDLVDDDPMPLGSWVNFELGEDSSQLKNVVYITGIYVADNKLYTQNAVGDGTTTMIQLNYQPPNDQSTITVSVAGVQYAIALDQVDSIPSGPCQAQTAYVNFSAQTVRFCTAPAQGAAIVITYYPMLNTVVAEQDTASQTAMAAISGTDGVFEYNRMDPSLSAETPTLAQTRAAMTLTKYAYPIAQGSFTSFISGWRVGMYFTLKSQRRYQGIYDGVNFFVTRVRKTLVQTIEGGAWQWQWDLSISSIPFEI